MHAIAAIGTAIVPGQVYTISGLLVGFLVGMTGVGGGSLMTPLLILFLGVRPQAAVGTDLIYAGVTKLAGTLFNRQRDAVSWPIVFRLMAGSLPGALASLLVLHFMGQNSGGQHSGIPAGNAVLISKALGVCLLITAPAIVLRPVLHRLSAGYARKKRPGPSMQDGSEDRQKWEINEKITGTTTILTVLLGFVLGAMVALSSVGAGAIGMAVLVMLYPSIPLRILVATDIAHAVPLTLIAGAGHWVEGAVDISILLHLLLGSIPGILLGILCAGKLPDIVQRWILGIILLVIGLKMVLG